MSAYRAFLQYGSVSLEHATQVCDAVASFELEPRGSALILLFVYERFLLVETLSETSAQRIRKHLGQLPNRVSRALR